MSEASRPRPPRLPPVGDGLLVVDKPTGWTSHDVVGRARRLCGTRRVGHAGTLDPMATGVLVLGVDKGTKLLTFLVGADKDYTATIRLGQATVTDDAEGDVTAEAPTGAVADLLTADGRRRVDAAVAASTGDIEQVPSAVSAIKIDGKRSYARVRGGEQVDLPARPVTVSRFDVHDVRLAHADSGVDVLDLDLTVTVSSGTYVRALARDLGAAIGVGGHLTALRRTRVGGLTLEHAADLERIEADGAASHLVPLADAARAALPTRELTEEQARDLGFGRRIPSADPGRTDAVAAFAPDGRLVAILDETRETARPHVVISPA